MDDLFAQLPTTSWYALVAATPRPESGEAANVAVLFGNGRAYGLRFVERLPRLCGIAAADEINVYEAVLRSVNETIGRQGLELTTVAAMLAPQMAVQPPRPLLRDADDMILEQLARRFLAAPSEPARETNPEALITKSLTKLDDELARVKGRGVSVQRNVQPSTLYEGRLDRFVPYAVPRISRALRGFSRDVLIDSLLVDSEHDVANIHRAASRIGHAFYSYDRKLRSLIREYSGRELRTVGVLQPGRPDDSQETVELREYISDTWSQHARVVDGNKEDIVAALTAEAEWAGAS